MNAYSFLAIKRSLAAMALILLGGCALQNKTKTPEKPRSAQSAAASAVAAEAAATAPAKSIATEQKAAQPVATPETKADSETSLSIGIGMYESGDYNGAIRQLQNATRNWKGNKQDRVKAVKYIAFSYCLTERKILCRRSFVRALKLDQGFDLDAGEKGHPLWGPEFERAKRSVQAKPGKPAIKKK